MTEVIETVAISDSWVSGCSRIENAGGDCLRYYLYAQQGDEKVLVAKIVCPVNTALEIAEMKRQFATQGATVVEDEQCVAAHH
jgi:hypothetical protein